MAQTWEEILAEAKLSASERTLLDNIVQRVPEFKDGRLRQADYSRQALELQKRQKEYDDAVATAQRVQGWYDDRKPEWDALVEAGAIDENGDPIWPKEKARLSKELEDAKRQALTGGDMDPAELDKRVREIVKANGGVTTEELKALIISEGQKLAVEAVNTKYAEFEKKFNEETIPFNMGMSAANALAALDYEKTTGEEFTADKQKELFTLMQKESNFDPRSAMKIMLKPVVEKKAMNAEVERLADEKARKMVADRGEVLGDQPFIPQGAPPSAQGSLQRMLEQSAAEEGDIESLVMAGGRKAAAELRNEGKGR